jgi:predicted RNA-binding protein with PIN domain
VFNKLLNLFRKKKIAFIDGDQSIQHSLKIYKKYLANTNTETHLIKLLPPGHNQPKLLKNVDFNKIYISEYTSSKECVDKFIGAYIQHAVSAGYQEITVVSSDYDFIDIFKMASMIDQRAKKITFRLIVPQAKGRLNDLPPKFRNIEVIK